MAEKAEKNERYRKMYNGRCGKAEKSYKRSRCTKRTVATQEPSVAKRTGGTRRENMDVAIYARRQNAPPATRRFYAIWSSSSRSAPQHTTATYHSSTNSRTVASHVKMFSRRSPPLHAPFQCHRPPPRKHIIIAVASFQKRHVKNCRRSSAFQQRAHRHRPKPSLEKVTRVSPRHCPPLTPASLSFKSRRAKNTRHPTVIRSASTAAAPL